ncbi:MAG: hypothetical protein ACYSWU_03535 [Planctomycetota bacterium]|jgi:hypothetical protein
MMTDPKQDKQDRKGEDDRPEDQEEKQERRDPHPLTGGKSPSSLFPRRLGEWGDG